jgi:hypothetical protein
MSISFYYDNMPEEQKMTVCHKCEYNVYDLKEKLPDDLISKIHDAISDAVIRNDDSEETKKLLAIIGKEDCEYCQGKGYVFFKDFSEVLNFSNDNAVTLLSMMGYKGDQLYNHSVPISEFKRRLMYAKNISTEKFERPDYIEYGKPREINNIVHLKPVKIMSMGLSAEEIRNRLLSLEDFVLHAEQNQAKEIYWG